MSAESTTERTAVGTAQQQAVVPTVVSPDDAAERTTLHSTVGAAKHAAIDAAEHAAQRLSVIPALADAVDAAKRTAVESAVDATVVAAE